MSKMVKTSEKSTRMRILLRECFAELLGVYVVILFGNGSMAQMITSKNTKGNYMSVCVAYALATTFAIYITRGVSGAQLNPALCFSKCYLGTQPWWKFPFYMFFQLLGAFLGAATVYTLYYDAIMYISKGNLTVTGPTGTARIFATYPSDYLSFWNGYIDQIIGAATLQVCLTALADNRNSPVSPDLEPLIVGSLVCVLGLSMGANCGYPLNPACDFGPRLFTYFAGWGSEVFRAGGGWFWVPLVAPFLGALVGVCLYHVLIGFHHPGTEDDSNQGFLIHNKMTDAMDVSELRMNNFQPFSKEGEKEKSEKIDKINKV